MNLCINYFQLLVTIEKKLMQKFSGMINALSFGAPPHGGIAPGLDRIVMLTCKPKKYKRNNIIPYEPKRSRFNDESTIRS